jgi:hypothetical protein
MKIEESGYSASFLGPTACGLPFSLKIVEERKAGISALLVLGLELGPLEPVALGPVGIGLRVGLELEVEDRTTRWAVDNTGAFSICPIESPKNT